MLRCIEIPLLPLEKSCFFIYYELSLFLFQVGMNQISGLLFTGICGQIFARIFVIRPYMKFCIRPISDHLISGSFLSINDAKIETGNFLIKRRNLKMHKFVYYNADLAVVSWRYGAAGLLPVIRIRSSSYH